MPRDMRAASTVLVTLAGLGESSSRDLAAVAQLRQQTSQNVLAALRAKGLVRIMRLRRDNESTRRQIWSITEMGRAWLAEHPAGSHLPNLIDHRAVAARAVLAKHIAENHEAHVQRQRCMGLPETLIHGEVCR